LFQPPLSHGLLWYKVYIYNKSNPHKIVTNLAQKYDLFFCIGAKSYYHVISSYYDFSRIKSPKNSNTIVLRWDRFQNFNFSNFESLSQQTKYKKELNITLIPPGFPPPSGYLMRSGRNHRIPHARGDTTKVIDCLKITQHLIRHVETVSYDTQCGGMVSSMMLLNNDLISQPKGWCLNPLDRWE